MLNGISLMVSFDPLNIVQQPCKSTFVPIAVALTTLLLGGAAISFHPIAATSLVIGSAIVGTVVMIRYLWASRIAQLNDEKEKAYLQSEVKCEDKLAQLVRLEHAIKELVFCEPTKTNLINSKVLEATSLFHMVQTEHPKLGRESFDRFNHYASERGLLKGILQYSTKDGVQKNSENAIYEFFSSEASFFESMQKLTVKNWILKDEVKGSFFDKLESEELISESEKQAISGDLEAIVNALKAFFAALGREESMEQFLERFKAQNYSVKVRACLFYFSPENLQQLYKSMGIFIKKYEAYLEILERVFESEKGKSLRQEFFEKNDKQSCNSIFIKPIQRVAQYKLLWDNFGKFFADSSIQDLILNRSDRFDKAIIAIHEKANKIWKNRKLEEIVSVWTV